MPAQAVHGNAIALRQHCITPTHVFQTTTKADWQSGAETTRSGQVQVSRSTRRGMTLESSGSSSPVMPDGAHAVRSMRRAMASMRWHRRLHGQQTWRRRALYCFSTVKKQHLTPHHHGLDARELDAGLLLMLSSPGAASCCAPRTATFVTSAVKTLGRPPTASTNDLLRKLFAVDCSVMPACRTDASPQPQPPSATLAWSPQKSPQLLSPTPVYHTY